MHDLVLSTKTFVKDVQITTSKVDLILLERLEKIRKINVNEINPDDLAFTKRASTLTVEEKTLANYNFKNRSRQAQGVGMLAMGVGAAFFTFWPFFGTKLAENTTDTSTSDARVDLLLKLDQHLENFCALPPKA